jgi:hypothetical protein
MVDSWDQLNNQSHPPPLLGKMWEARNITPDPRGDLVTEWRAAVVSLPSLFYLVAVTFGAIALSTGIDHLLFPTTSIGRLPALLFVFVGVWFLAIGLGSIFFTAKTIKWTEAGELNFSSWRRELEVSAGELVSVHSMPLDWNRLLPFRIKAIHGSIFIWPRFNDMDRLGQLLCSHSPDAEVDRLLPFSRT